MHIHDNKLRKRLPQFHETCATNFSVGLLIVLFEQVCHLIVFLEQIPLSSALSVGFCHKAF